MRRWTQWTVWPQLYRGLVRPHAPPISPTCFPIVLPFRFLSGASQPSPIFDSGTKVDPQKRIQELESHLQSEKSARIEAENARIEAENARIAAEKSKIEAEKSKIAAENARDEAVRSWERSEGRRWALFENLDQISVCKCSQRIYSRPLGTLVQGLLPPTGATPMEQATKLPRSPPESYFKTDVFGSPKTSEHEIAHLVPHSRRRAVLWISILQSILDVRIEPKNAKFQLIYEKIVEGYRLTSKRKNGTGLIYQPYNNIALAQQGLWFDEKPSVSFFPILSFSEMVNWDGEEYEAIFMASEADVVQKVGATRGTPLEYQGNNKKIQKAFSGFQEAASSLLGLMSAYNGRENHDSNFYSPQDDVLSHSLRNYLAGRNYFLAPKPNNSPEIKYRVVKFTRAKALGDDSSFEGHPAPIPLLLVAKSLNAWFSHLLRKNLLDGFPVSEAQFCAVFPICGVDHSDASCPVCLARRIVRSDSALESLDYLEREYDHARRIAAYQEFAELESDPLLMRAANVLHKVTIS